MTLRLVQLGLSGAAMFTSDGRVLQPAEALRHHPVLIERGRFRPMTVVNADMLECAATAFDAVPGSSAAQCKDLAEAKLKEATTSVVSSLVKA